MADGGLLALLQRNAQSERFVTAYGSQYPWQVLTFHSCLRKHVNMAQQLAIHKWFHQNIYGRISWEASFFSSISQWMAPISQFALNELKVGSGPVHITNFRRPVGYEIGCEHKIKSSQIICYSWIKVSDNASKGTTQLPVFVCETQLLWSV